MEEIKDYPPYMDYPKPHKAKTNADRIRAMSNEELAKMLTVGDRHFCMLRMPGIRSQRMLYEMQ